MEVKINDTYSIESDERNFVLKRRILREARDGQGSTGTGFNEYFDYTYYWTLEQLTRAVMEKTAKNSAATEIQELNDVFESCMYEITECLKSEGMQALYKFTMATREGTDPTGILRTNVPVKAKRGRKPGSKNKVKK